MRNIIVGLIITIISLKFHEELYEKIKIFGNDIVARLLATIVTIMLALILFLMYLIVL